VSYSAIVIADSPVSYWRLGEPSGTTATDQMGAHNGTYGSSPTLGVAGALDDGNTAATFTTQFQVVDVTSWSIPTTAITLEAWIKGTAFGSTAGLMGHWNTNGAGIQLNSSSNIEFRINGTVLGRNAATYNNGSWHHIVATWTGTTGAIYFDGAIVGATQSMSGPITIPSGNFIIANVADASHSGFNGSIDEVAVYASALNSAQVAAHYAARITSATIAWVSPADTSPMNITPILQFTSPVAAVPQHFELQLDTVNTFNSGNLRDVLTATSQAGWTYFDGSAWVSLTSAGLPAAKSGNDVRYSVPTALSMTTWYRRVRAATVN
jgi:hypothetical protein